MELTSSDLEQSLRAFTRYLLKILNMNAFET